MSGEPPPVGPDPADQPSVPPAPVPSSVPSPAVNAPAPARPGIHWALVLVGVPIGFVAWVVGSLLVLTAAGNLSDPSVGSVVALAVLVPLLVASVGLIVWRRSRQFAQGFVLGAAIGLVVAGGLCIPLVTSLGGF